MTGMTWAGFGVSKTARGEGRQRFQEKKEVSCHSKVIWIKKLMFQSMYFMSQRANEQLNTVQSVYTQLHNPHTCKQIQQ